MSRSLSLSPSLPLSLSLTHTHIWPFSRQILCKNIALTVADPQPVTTTDSRTSLWGKGWFVTKAKIVSIRGFVYITCFFIIKYCGGLVFKHLICIPHVAILQVGWFVKHDGEHCQHEQWLYHITDFTPQSWWLHLSVNLTELKTIPNT